MSPLLILIPFVFILAAFVIIFFENAKKDRMKKGKAKRVNNVFVSTERYMKYDRYFFENFLTRGSYRRIRNQLGALSIYTPPEIRIQAVRFYAISNLVAFLIVALVFALFRDVFSTILVSFMIVVLKNVLIQKQLDNLNFKILKDLQICLSSIRQNYLRLGNIPDAVAEAEVTPELSRPLEEIYLVLTSNDSEKRLNRFQYTNPYSLLRTLCNVCYIIDNAGDTRMSDGTSNFIQAISMMVDEVNLEIRKLTLQRNLFGSLEYLPVFPVFLTGPAEMGLTAMIPGTSAIYSSPMGYMSKTIIILAGVICYMILSNVNRPSTVKENDRLPLVNTLLKFPPYLKIVKDLMPKKNKAKAKWSLLIKSSLSKQSLEHVYGLKLLWFIGGFLGVLVLCFFIVNLGKEYVYKNVQEMSLVSTEKLSEKEIKERQQIDAYFLSMPNLPPDKSLKEYLKDRYPKMKPLDLDAQVARIKNKYETYKNSFFKWWFLIIAFVVALLCWTVPERILKSRHKLIKMDAEEDVLQMQTMIAILMNTQIDTMGALYWLEKQSKIHKDPIIYCYHEYPSNPEGALRRMRRQAPLAEFKRMVDKLILTIHQITLSEAFSDLLNDRSHTLRLREVYQDTIIRKRRAQMKYVSLAPLFLLVGLYLLLPMVILGLGTFMEAFTNLKH